MAADKRKADQEEHKRLEQAKAAHKQQNQGDGQQEIKKEQAGYPARRKVSK
jgi:hypothetical protein